MNKIFSIALVGVATLVLVGTTLASTVSAQSRIEDKAQGVRCDVWNKRVNVRINNFNSRKDAHIANYNRISDYLGNLADEYDAKGYDTSKLRADGVTWDQMVVDLGNDYAAFIKRIEETEDLVCGSSGGEYKQTLQEAKTMLSTVRSDARAIRVYYYNTIKPDIQALKAQNPSPTPAASVQ